ncbi:hypothetical protein D3C80_2237780 [compost metagenome]
MVGLDLQNSDPSHFRSDLGEAHGQVRMDRESFHVREITLRNLGQKLCEAATRCLEKLSHQVIH